MPFAMLRSDIAGAVIVVVNDGGVLLQKGYGYADTARRLPVDAQRTLFRPASISKLFTWTAVMQLVEQGKIDLDADVNRYLDFKIPDRAGGPITMRHLMTHTAGFEEAARGLFTRASPASLETEVKRAIPRRVYAAGTTTAYSNYGAALAGYIVQRVTRMPYEKYVEQAIFAPLDMQHSTFRQPTPAVWARDVSNGYRLGSDEPRYFEFLRWAPAGGLTTSGADMARFMLAHLQLGELDGQRILNAATAREMQQTALVLLPPLDARVLGFMRSSSNGHRTLSHGGDTQFFHSRVSLYPDDAVGLFISLNSEGRNGGADALRAGLFQQFADRYLQPAAAPAAQGHVDTAIARRQAHIVEGTYVGTRRPRSNFLAFAFLFGQHRVAADDSGTLAVEGIEGLDGRKKRWRPIAPWVWRETNGPQRLAVQTIDGRPTRFSTDEDAGSVMFELVPWWQSSAWLVPALYASLGTLAVAGLQWPVAALLRRRKGGARMLAGQELLASRATRVAAIAAVATMIGWLALIDAMLADIGLTVGSDALLFLLFSAGVLFIGAGSAAALWSAAHTWRRQRSYGAKVWSSLLAAAFLVLLWIAAAFNLLNFATDF